MDERHDQPGERATGSRRDPGEGCGCGLGFGLGFEAALEGVIESAIGGDRDALELLWKHTRRWVAAILLAHKPLDADLEDLLQIVAMQMCRKIGDVREPRAFKSWLRTVTINAALQEGRRTQRRRRSILRLVGLEQSGQRGAYGGHGAQPAQALALALERDESRRIFEAAMSLPAGYREPVLLRCLKSMSYAEIARALDLPTTTIETRIARGRRMLRELLEQQEQTAEAQPSSASAGGGAR